MSNNKLLMKIQKKNYVYASLISNAKHILMYEPGFDIIVQFIHDHNLKSCGWITIDNPKYSSINESYCDISYKVSEKKIKSANSDYDLKMAPFRVCAYDIETISSDDGFPQARRKDDKIVSIACTFNEINKECDTRVVLIVHNEKFKIDKEHKVIICKDEEELINEWMQLIIDEDPDIITSWNGFGFDDNYIIRDMYVLTVEKDFMKM